jgi:CheY-like chemotaxis protein/DNA-binding MarR family transcriptional regulator
MSFARTITWNVSAPWKVLVVDDDPSCLSEYAELIETLGYDCITAPDALSALKLLVQDPDIALVILDLKMPEIDGFTLLDELSQRFMANRPLVAVVITADVSAEVAIKALRSDATDFLEKPFSVASLAATLRRAKARWTQLARHPIASPQVETVKQRFIADQEPSRADLQAFATLLLNTRRNRSKFFDPEVVTSPAWDILVELAVAGLENRKVATSSVCVATEVPFSTALRYVNQLVDSGLVHRVSDPSDRRRTLLELEPATFDLMKRYLEASMFGKSDMAHRRQPEPIAG